MSGLWVKAYLLLEVSRGVGSLGLKWFQGF